MVKTLYLAVSIDELNAKVDLLGDNNKTNIGRLLKSSPKVYDAASLAEREKDEEKAFLYYSRYVYTILTIMKNDNYKSNKTYYEKQLDRSKVSQAINRSEQLKDSLTKRYALKREANDRDLQEKLNQTKIHNSLNDKKAKEQSAEHRESLKPLESDGFMSVHSLCSLIQQKSSSFLIVDIRPSKDYQTSHICALNTINIPEEILHKGCTAVSLCNKIGSEANMLWSRRGRYDKLIIADWFTEKTPLPVPLAALMESITTWDPTTTYSATPVVLKGGFELWLLAYPMHVTNSSIKVPSQDGTSPVDVAPSYLQISYPSLDTAFIASPKPVEEAPPADHFNDNSEKKTPQNNVTKYPSVNSLKQNGYVIPSTVKQYPESPVKKLSTLPRIDRNLKPLDERDSSADSATPLMPSRALKPKDLLESADKGMIAEEKKLMEDTMEMEKKALSKLSEIEKAKNSTSIQRLEDELKTLYSNKEITDKRLDQMAQQNKELWRFLNSVLSGPNGDINGTSGDINGTSGDKFTRDKLSTHQSDHQDMKRNVERMRQERKEKEMRLRRKKESSATHQSRIGGESSYNAPLKPPRVGGGSPDRYSGGSNLRRSHSAFNLSQLEDSLSSPFDNSKTSPPAHQKPMFDRSVKPMQANKLNVNLAKYRDFGPMGGVHSRSGLKNLGNTCYQNAMVQCLATLKLFTSYFEKERHYEQLNPGSPSKGEVAQEFGAVIKALTSRKYKTVAMRDLKQIVGKYFRPFRGTDHHDAHEFLLKLSDWLHDDLNMVQGRKLPLPEQNHSESTPDYIAAEAYQNTLKARDHSVMRRIFYGLQRNVLSCKLCDARSLTFEPFSALSLTIPTSGRSNLIDLVRNYFPSDSVSYNCTKCNRSEEGTMTKDIWELPPILILHLNRFELKDMRMTSKNPNFVDFPLDSLDLDRLVVYEGNRIPKVKSRYVLKGVVNHYGTMDGGHYTAFCRKNEFDWEKCDDQEIYDISPSKVKTSAAYVLFYQSVSIGN